jgi:hypothetical protein
MNGSTVSEYAKRRLHRIGFLVVFVAIAVDDGSIAATMVVAHPVSLCGIPWSSDE